jgi:hypothetical protein
LLFGELSDEVLNNGLEEVLDSEVAISGNLVQEALFELDPGLEDVPLFGEEAAHQDVVFELVGEVQFFLELEQGAGNCIGRGVGRGKFGDLFNGWDYKGLEY